MGFSPGEWLGEAALGDVKGAFEGLGKFAVNVREAITGEAVLTSEQKAALLQQAQYAENMALTAALAYDTEQMKGQIEIAKIDQASGSFFQSGWRPFVAWVCGFGFAYMVALRPLLPWFIRVAGIVLEKDVSAIPDLPSIDTEVMVTILFGMLGLGTMRSAERIKGAIK